jgi:hypothetical protein
MGHPIVWQIVTLAMRCRPRMGGTFQLPVAPAGSRSLCQAKGPPTQRSVSRRDMSTTMSTHAQSGSQEGDGRSSSPRGRETSEREMPLGR